MDPIIVIYTVFTIGGVGMITGELSYRKRKPALAIFGGAFMVTLNILLLMYAQARMMNVDLVDYIISIYRESFEVQKEMMGLDMDVETFLLNLRRTFPGMVVCMGFAVSAVNYFLSGMHSYGQNDNVHGIFTYLYIALGGVVVLAVLSYRRGKTKG